MKNVKMHYTEKQRAEIRRGTSWLDPKYLDYTEKQFQEEMKRMKKLLSK